MKYLFALFTIALLLVVTGCENPAATAPEAELTASSAVASFAKGSLGSATTVSLWAGQSINVGTVSVNNDENTLYITYTVTGGWTLSQTHVDISTAAFTERGAPGKYLYKTTHAAGTVTYTYDVPMTWNPGQTISVRAHAAVEKAVNGAVVQSETAMGGTVVKPAKGSWYAVFTYTIQQNRTYAISGYMYEDCNENGTFDSGEKVYGNVPVSLNNGAVTSTNADGFYIFSGLIAGSYSVTSGEVQNAVHVTANPVLVTIVNSDASANFGFQPLYKISGYAYYDVNNNGSYDPNELPLSNVNISLSGFSSAASVTNTNGYYEFTGLRGCGTGKQYTVSTSSVTGLAGTTPASVSVTVLHSNQTANFGYSLDLNWIKSQTATGFTIGYWKNNLDKAIQNKTSGVQVSKAALETYVAALSNYQLAPLNVTTMQEASDIMSSTTSDPVGLLSKQLMGSEFNVQNGAYIGGNQMITLFFTYYGEYIAANPSQFTSAQIIAAKDMFDGYNNSHGGLINF